METNESSKYQQLVFLLLDPIIKQLLRCQEDLNFILLNSTVKDTSNQSSSFQGKEKQKHENDTSNILSLCKKQVNLFQSLEQLLGNLAGVDNDDKPTTSNMALSQKDDKIYLQNAFREMEKYITLPIILCLQQISKLQTRQREEVDLFSDDNKIFEIIKSSALRNAIESAASCLTTFVHCLCQKGPHDDTSNMKHSSDSASTLMSVEIWLKCIIVVSTAMTLVIDSLNPTSSTTIHHNEESNPKSLDNDSSSQLDKGDECLGALLRAVFSLLTNVSDGLTSSKAEKNTDKNIFVKELFTFIPNGGLIFGIIQNCIHCLNHNWSSGKGDIKERREDDVEKILRGNVQLQLDSLDVLEALLSISWADDSESDKVVDCFQQVFPTSFGVLFRHTHLHLRFSTSMSSSKLTVRFITILSKLINKALGKCSTNQSSCSNSPSTNLHNEQTASLNVDVPNESALKLLNAARMMQLNQSSTDSSVSKITSTTILEMDSDEQDFIENVQKRIPTPLSILCKLIPSQKSKYVKKAGVHLLCKTILIDTIVTWNNSSAGNIEDDLERSLKSLRESAFECLVILLDDSHDEVVRASKEVMNLHKLTLNQSGDRNLGMNDQTMISNVMGCIQNLPSMARSRKEHDLRLKIKLICGYISVLVDQKKNKRNNYLLKKLIKDPYKSSLQDLFTLGDSTANNPGITPVSNSPQFMYMLDDKTVEVAKRMVHKVAQLLGIKLSLLYVDDCIADTFEAISTRLQNNHTSTQDLNHFRWIQQQFGLITIAVELINGLKPMKFNSRQVESLDAFTISTLPILFSDHFWQLPTTSNWASRTKLESKGVDCTNHIKVIQNSSYDFVPTSNSIVRTKPFQYTSNLFSDVSFVALHGNSLVQCGLMALVCGLAELHTKHFQQYMTSVLYPLLQKTSDVNCNAVQQSAIDTLQRIAVVCELGSFEDLLSHNFRFIIEVFTSQLQTSFFVQTEKHVHQQSIGFCTLQTVMKFLKQSNIQAGILSSNLNRSDDYESNIMLVVGMMKTLNDWFVKNFNKGIHALASVMVIPNGMLEVFIMCVEYIQTHFATKKEKSKTKTDEFHWMNLLIQFELDDNPSNRKKTEDLNHNCFAPASPEKVLSIDTMKEIIGVIQKVMLTNSVFLSIPDLKIQKLSCDMFNTAFSLLHSVQQYCKLAGEDTSDVGNPLLESVSKYWHPLQTRFQSTCASLCLRNENEPARMHLIMLLSSLLEIISTLSELCDGFMCQRFQTSIFPHMSKIYQIFVGHIDNTKVSLSLYSKEDRRLLAPMLKCTQRVFSAEGSDLCQMVPIVGSIILPFISVEGDIGESAMLAMKALLAIDSDCMWRALLNGSGSEFPQRSLLPLETPPKSKVGIKSNFSKSCLKLIEFVDTLPEHSIIAL